MIEKYLSATWNAAAPAFANHLWQSTLFAAAAALLTLVLRKHHARSRYWLWLAASVKFLVPFSLLAGVGSHLATAPAYYAATRPALYLAMDEIGQPFTPSAPHVRPTPAMASSLLPHILPVLVALWLCGCAAVLLVWALRWRRISAALQTAQPLRQGREVVALRRIERIAGIRKRIELVLSRTSLEPGIFGIARPVLIWPEGISKRLDDAHLDAILAHEVWHVRRRDNFFATLHMIVQAVFWFYPLVWWLGARLLEERERACDEEVVESGSDREVYAESILKVCEFCVGSPLACVSGVTGADLRKRMVHIMTDRISHKLDFARKLLLTTAALLAFAAPITFGLLHPTPTRAQSQDAATSTAGPVLESASIRPNQSPGRDFTQLMFSLEDGSFRARGVTLRKLIQMAYRVQDTQVAGGPEWLNSAKFDIDAKMDKSFAAEQHRNISLEQRAFDDQRMLRELLTTRFKLAVHSEGKNLPVYELVLASDGAKVQESKGPGRMRLGRGELSSQGVPISLLADDLSRRLGRTVLDKTGLKGNYTFDLHWTPDAGEDARFKEEGGPPVPATASPEPAGSSLIDALEEQLGLKLESRTDSVPVLVVDHAEAPTEKAGASAE